MWRKEFWRIFALGGLRGPSDPNPDSTRPDPTDIQTGRQVVGSLRGPSKLFGYDRCSFCSCDHLCWVPFSAFGL